MKTFDVKEMGASSTINLKLITEDGKNVSMRELFERDKKRMKNQSQR